ncbi:hypothetical protein D9615_005783 [Tricholomella constricta]|uniref:Uncharacterized protein n=1 Tax=Tricholomella constricta TaxID=117010 RepID=A0A8H5HAQ7_9AGAR|nr:hypothetical protein D9615_005783 [Tricholomella constricta]
MLPTRSNRSYSEFFTSGFRAMSRRHVSAIPSPSVTTPDSPPTTRSTRRHSSFISFTNRSSRTTSMIISSADSVKTLSTESSSASSSSSSSARRHRRSSFVTFSSWLFDRKGSSAHADNYLSFSSSPPKNKRELLGSSEVTEVWITAGGPFTPTSISKSSSSNGEPSLFQPIDPFSASPDSKSFFIDLTDSSSSSPSLSPSPPTSTSTTRRTSKRESFLSFSGSSPDRSSFLHLPMPPRRRERPTSVQTLPILPSPSPSTSPSKSKSKSRRSSYLYRAPSRSQGHSSRYSWTTVEEEESRAGTPEPMVEDLPEERSDPAQNIDWRQFHVELLRVEA